MSERRRKRSVCLFDEEQVNSPVSQKEILTLLTICKSLLSELQFYYFLHNYRVLPCSQQSPVHKYCTSNYKDAWRRAEPDQMGCSQAAYDSPRQKLARSPRGRSSDAAKHDTVVFFFPSFFFLFCGAGSDSAVPRQHEARPPSLLE